MAETAATNESKEVASQGQEKSSSQLWAHAVAGKNTRNTPVLEDWTEHESARVRCARWAIPLENIEEEQDEGERNDSSFWSTKPVEWEFRTVLLDKKELRAKDDLGQEQSIEQKC